MEGLERLATRLENARAVEPIVSALRTIALGNRLAAINRARMVAEYCRELLNVLPWVAPCPGDSHPAWCSQGERGGHLHLLVVGSERGLCGAFNDTVAAHARQILARHTAAGVEVTLMSLGRQAQQALRRQGWLPVLSSKLSGTALPPYELAREITLEWLGACEKGEMGAVDVVYNTRRGMAGYSPTTTRLLPLELPAGTAEESPSPPIIDTEPMALCRRVARLWLAAVFYGILLDSAAAEHSARYQLLEGASQNAQRMIEELNLSLQVARQEAITAEVQDLASGAGLIGPLPGRES